MKKNTFFLPLPPTRDEQYGHTHARIHLPSASLSPPLISQPSEQELWQSALVERARALLARAVAGTATATLTPASALLVAAALVDHSLEGAGVVVLALAGDRVQGVSEEHGFVAAQKRDDAGAGIGGALAALLGLLLLLLGYGVMVEVGVQMVRDRRSGRRREEDDGTGWIGHFCGISRVVSGAVELVVVDGCCCCC